MDWITSTGLTNYKDALDFMDNRVAAILAGSAGEAVWLVEHPPLYTAGTSAKPSDLVDPHRFPVFTSARGGEYTYHGPGQRVAYVMVDLNKRGRDVRRYVDQLEAWIIDTLATFAISGRAHKDRVGVWVPRATPMPGGGQSAHEDKIAAIGVRIRKWVTMHGISINLTPNLGHYDGIVPCGISEHGITSFSDLGLPTTMAQLDQALREAFFRQFGQSEPAGAALPQI